MIEIYTQRFADVEVLHAVPSGMSSSSLPTIVFYHGFTSSKLVYSYFAVALAQQGFRVIMPDARDHGARYNGDAPARLQQFWVILKNSIEEFPALYRALLTAGLIADGRLAVGGASMGGMTALGIMARHPEVRCAASLMGSGYFSTLAETLFPPPDGVREEVIAGLKDYDAGKRPERLCDRPLLLWHGEDDDVVPAVETLKLQQRLSAGWLEQNLTCIVQPGVKHRITPEALEAASQFFSRHL